MKTELTNIEVMNKGAFSVPYRYATNHFAIAHGNHIAFIDEGPVDAPPIVMIHGLGGYIKHWYPTVMELSHDYRCIAIDLPGYGDSGAFNLPEKDILSSYVEGIDVLMNELDLKGVTLLGHSMGGQISIIAAYQKPDWLSKLVIAAPAGFETFTPQENDIIKQLMTTEAFLSQTEEQVRKAFAKNFVSQPDWVEEMIQDRLVLSESNDFTNYCQMRSALVASMLDYPVNAFLSQIELPTLVLFGAEDQLIPNRVLHPDHTVRSVAEVYHDMPNAQLEIIDEAGHMLQVEKPHQFNRQLVNFLNQT